MSNNTHTLYFKFSDGIKHDAKISEISLPLRIEYKHHWSIIPDISLLTGTPTYSIEVSNDDVNYRPLDQLTVNAPIAQGFDANQLNYLYLRINYVTAPGTTGVITFPIVLKSHS